MRRSIPSSRARSTSRSAERAQCSSPTRSRPSPTSRAHFGLRGRLALVSWQGPERNEWFLAFVDALTLGRGLAPPPPNAPSPFAHADPSRIERILTDSGFTEVRIDPLELPMYFGATIDEGYRVLRELLAWMARGLEPGERAEAFQRLHETLLAHESPDGLAYQSRAWLVTAVRR